MRGSGIDSLDYTRSFSCHNEECEAEQDVEFGSEYESGDIEWVCEKCKSENTSSFELSAEVDPDENFDD